MRILKFNNLKDHKHRNTLQRLCNEFDEAMHRLIDKDHVDELGILYRYSTSAAEHPKLQVLLKVFAAQLMKREKIAAKAHSETHQ